MPYIVKELRAMVIGSDGQGRADFSKLGDDE